MGQITYITNPPSAIPVCTQINGTTPFTTPVGYVRCEPLSYPNLDPKTAALGDIQAIIGWVSDDHLTGEGSAFANQQVIDEYNVVCQTWQAAQLTAWNAVGQPATYLPTTPMPVAPMLPMGDFKVIWDPNEPGQAYFGPQATDVPAGVCPPFVAPVAASDVPYISQLLGVYKCFVVNGKVLSNVAVFSMVPGKDTVSIGETVTLFAGMNYGGYTYDGAFGETLDVVLVPSFMGGKGYYVSAASVVPVA